jgi:GT2 family glycosyltransferase
VRAAVIIPNGNGRRLLSDCLGSLRRQIYPDFTTLVVDNASTDGSVEYVRGAFPEVDVLPLGYNGVFAATVNAGIEATSSEIVVLLNNDTEAEPDWLGELIAALDREPRAGAATSKLLLFDRRDALHSAGDFYGVDAMPGSRGVWTRDDGRYDADRFVFGASGAAAAYRRRVLDDVGRFDESLTAYCEDVDLNLRLRLAGYEVAFAPRARVYHRLSATGGGPLASYYTGRNFLVVAAKDLPAPILRRHWPKIVRRQLAMALHSLWHAREPAARAKLRGQAAGIAALPRALLRRRYVERKTRIPPEPLECWLALGDRPIRDQESTPPTPC